MQATRTPLGRVWCRALRARGAHGNTCWNGLTSTRLKMASVTYGSFATTARASFRESSFCDDDDAPAAVEHRAGENDAPGVGKRLKVRQVSRTVHWVLVLRVGCIVADDHE